MGNKRYAGTTRKTWLEVEHGRVGRRYERDKLQQVLQIHDLCLQLRNNHVPVQQPLGPPKLVGDNVIAYYEYEHDDGPTDYEDAWYNPIITSARRRHAAHCFARFQRAALRLKGPEQPLDYPFCNSLHWTKTDEPIRTLLGQWATAEPELQHKLGLDELRKLIDDLLPKALARIAHAPFGLCHGDFHSGNTIFQGDRLAHIVDFGFWIQHPLIFDLAIAVEFWGQESRSNLFYLNRRFIYEFLDAYKENRGPLGDITYLLEIAAISRLWIETSLIRRCKYPVEYDRVASHLHRIVLPRLRWYAQNAEIL